MRSLAVLPIQAIAFFLKQFNGIFNLTISQKNE
jgi:hypothetical protein